MAPERRLPALLSQLLVAFTVEFDGEFERRMGLAGYPGSRVSLAVWTDLLRFGVDTGVMLRDLMKLAPMEANQIKLRLGCLERWGYVTLDREGPDGWGSGRGLRGDLMVRLSARGSAGNQIWPELIEEIEARWEERFGKTALNSLRRRLREILGVSETTCLPQLLSRLLLAFQTEFDRESPAPLALCANTLRVLGEKPIRAAKIPALTGGSPEMSGIGWQIKPYVIVAPDPSARRGKAVSLSPWGLRAQQAYFKITAEIETGWEARFGEETIGRLRDLLRGFFLKPAKGGSALSEGLLPPPGTVRAGDLAPALGRRDVGAAAKQRTRDLVAQTAAFVRDPATSLPHFPMWDMNRGFGP